MAIVKTGVSGAEAQAREILVEAKDQALKIREAAAAEAESVRQQLAEVEKQKARLIEKLEKVTGLTREEAKQQLLKQLDEALIEEVARRIKEAEEKAKAEAEEKAKEILVEAMRHGATNYVAEYTVSTVKIPDEDAKGTIIGKEGRNI